jgi:hypothetical protein
MTPSTIFQIRDEQEFNALALEIFHHQSTACRAYAEFLSYLDRPQPDHYGEIPCLPISAFKTHEVYIGSEAPDITFSSSGTTGNATSKHAVKDLKIYEQSFFTHFRMRYGDLKDWCVLALLPSYLEREGSSLVYMVDQLIKASSHPDSGFFLKEHGLLAENLTRLKEQGQKTMLVGVSFALLDLTEQFTLDFPELVVMETGGMKGRKKELVRQDLHELLRKGFNVPQIHSEYGMTELLSQAYAAENGRFLSPPWMRVMVREVNDPFTVLPYGHGGGLNLIDLANVHSCSFIASDDLGKLHDDGSFEVLGRFDHSDMRGCSLLV